MTRTDKAKELVDRTSISKGYASKYNEVCAARRLAGRALTANRGVKLNGNNELEPVDHKDSHWYGIPYSQADMIRTQEVLVAVQGPAYAITQGGRIEPQQKFKFALGGKITKFVETSPARVICAATSGETGEITDTDANDEKITVVSNNAADVNLWALILGKQKTTGSGIGEFIPITGTTAVEGSLYFDEVYGVVILDAPNVFGTATAPTGTVTVTNESETTLVSLAAVNHMGLIAITSEDAYDRRVYAAIDTLAAAEIILYGIDEDGNEAADIVAWAAANDILKKESTERFNRIIYCAGGGVADARTIALNAAVNEDLFDGWTNNVGGATVTGDAGADNTFQILSDEAGDVGQKITVICANNAGTVFTEEITLNGTSPVSTQNDAKYFCGAYVSSGTPTGLITVEQSDTTDIFTFDSATYNCAGLIEPSGDNAGTGVKSGLDFDAGNSKITVTNSNGSATDKVIVVGYDKDGTAQTELLTLSSGTATTTKYWSIVDFVASIAGATTESFRVDMDTEDDGAKAAGIVKEPSDAADTKVEVELF